MLIRLRLGQYHNQFVITDTVVPPLWYYSLKLMVLQCYLYGTNSSFTNFKV